MMIADILMGSFMLCGIGVVGYKFQTRSECTSVQIAPPNSGFRTTRIGCAIECSAATTCEAFVYSNETGDCWLHTQRKVCPDIGCPRNLLYAEYVQEPNDCIYNQAGNYRLCNGNSPDRGRVEVLYLGVWGTVCDDIVDNEMSWDSENAAVVCKQFGYTYGDAVTGGTFGEGQGCIMLDEVDCTGFETSLFDCQHDPVTVNNCGHNEDVGVICY